VKEAIVKMDAACKTPLGHKTLKYTSQVNKEKFYQENMRSRWKTSVYDSMLILKLLTFVKAAQSLQSSFEH
jgi:hypothetical protein